MGFLSPQQIAKLRTKEHATLARKAAKAGRIVELARLLSHRDKWEAFGVLGVSAHHATRALHLAIKLPADLQEAWAALSSWELAAVLAESAPGQLVALNALPAAELRSHLQGSPDSLRRQLDAIPPKPPESPMSSAQKKPAAPKPMKVLGPKDQLGRALSPSQPQEIDGLCRWPGCAREPDHHRGLCKACYSRANRKGLREAIALPAQPAFSVVNGGPASAPAPVPEPARAPEPAPRKPEPVRARSGTYTFPEPHPDISPIVVLVDVDGYQERLLELDVQGRWVDTKTGEPPDYEIRVWSATAADTMPGSPERRQHLDIAWEGGQLLPDELEVFKVAALRGALPESQRGKVNNVLEQHPGLIQAVSYKNRPGLICLSPTPRGLDLAERWGLTGEAIKAESLQFQEQLDKALEEKAALQRELDQVRAELADAKVDSAELAKIEEVLSEHDIEAQSPAEAVASLALSRDVQAVELSNASQAPANQKAIAALYAHFLEREFYKDFRLAMLFAVAFPELTVQQLAGAAA